MEKIGDFKDLHKGEPVCVIGNGPSIHNIIPKIPKGMMTFGMNASLSHYYSPYWVGLDISTLWNAVREEYRPDYVFLPDAEGYEFKYATNIPIRTIFGRQWAWSHDLEEVIYPCRSTIWFVLQIVVYMGFDPIFLTGFDLKGPRPRGHVHADLPMEPKGIQHQLQLMGYLRAMLERKEIGNRIYQTYGDSTCTVFPYHTPMDQDDWNPLGYSLHAGKPKVIPRDIKH